MTGQAYLLDTNVLTGILKKDARIVNRLTEVLAADAQLILSPVVFYEIQRGLLRYKMPTSSLQPRPTA